MKLIACLLGLVGVLGFTGCESDEHEHYEHRGGVYDDSYGRYGHEYYRGSDRDGDHWEHREWRD